MKRSELIGSAVVLVVLVVAPWISPLIHVDLSTFSEVLLIAIAAMSVNLLLGYTGLPAFGNAAYFGLGAYGAGLSVVYFHVDFIVAVLIGTAAGFLGAVILGLGRALGETIAVAMVIGNRPEISASLFMPSTTLASVIANEFVEATSDLNLAALFELALVLLVLGLILNVAARTLVYNTTQRRFDRAR